MTCRYAVYFAPRRDSRWWAFGASWLGRDDARDVRLTQPALHGLDSGGMEALTAQPRRYGFHATIKPPFRLRDGETFDSLLAHLQLLAAGRRALPLGRLVPVYMDGFVALAPAIPNPVVQALAGACVTELDHLRAPVTQAERDRRRIDPADSRAAELFERYGYPHVLERFRFHMTLTGPVDMALGGQVVAQMARPIAQLNAQEPPVLDRLCLFLESDPDAPLRRVADVRLVK
jgi:putative phosphonate metabolism protein